MFHFRLSELVTSYIEDKDVEAVLAVGADMRKINFAFHLLKVIITTFPILQFCNEVDKFYPT